MSVWMVFVHGSLVAHVQFLFHVLFHAFHDLDRDPFLCHVREFHAILKVKILIYSIFDSITMKFPINKSKLE